MLLNAVKFLGYSFKHFWVIKVKPTGGRGVKLDPPPFSPKLGLSRTSDVVKNDIVKKNYVRYISC